MSEISTIEPKQALTARDIREQVNLIQEVMKSVMKKDVHYGVIPGCQKPSLYKPGAEKIASTFRITVTSDVEDLSTNDEKRFKVSCTAWTASGQKLGSSSGICSSNEEKYRWRRPVCDEEFVEFDGDRKREKWIRKDGKGIKIKQIRTEPSDLENTILQMADKRAYVAVVRKVTAASDVFTQDIEDLPEDVVAEIEGAQTNGKPEVKMPQEKKTEIPNNEVDVSMPPSETPSCSKCAAVISEKVKKYSMDKFKKVLCYDCQKTA